MQERNIQTLKYMVDETDEALLSFYLDNAKTVILNLLYPYKDWTAITDEETNEIILPNRYEGLMIRMAAYMVNKRGAEGQTQHNENNVFRYYGSADIPYDMINEIVPKAGAVNEAVTTQ